MIKAARISISSWSLVLLLILANPGTGFAVDEEQGRTSDAFSYTISTLVFGSMLDPAHSTQNPDNAFLDIYRYSTDFQVRPDLFLEQPYVSALFKPRFTASYRWWEDGPSKGRTDGADRAFVNEWRVQVKPHETLFLSFGKEKLLWGPSFLASPSNILFRDIEKANPKAEVEGKYLAKMIYIPDNRVTINLIRSTQKEENERQETFKPINVLKADILGSNFLISAIGYARQEDRFRMGSYGQWTASDALVLYYDGIVSKGTDALYPELNSSNPLGGAFSKRYDDSGRIFPTALVGGSYTFLTGSTFSMEYLYNGQGYSDADAREYYRLRQSASEHFFDIGLLSGLSRKTLGETVATGLPFLRRHYVMGQFQVREIRNVLDLIIRYTHGIEEGAGQAATIVEWQISDRVRFFNINSVAVNEGRTSEFNAMVSKSFVAGIEVHY